MLLHSVYFIYDGINSTELDRPLLIMFVYTVESYYDMVNRLRVAPLAASPKLRYS
jgi:hypothetical protein